MQVHLPTEPHDAGGAPGQAEVTQFLERFLRHHDQPPGLVDQLCLLHRGGGLRAVHACRIKVTLVTSLNQ